MKESTLDYSMYSEGTYSNSLLKSISESKGIPGWFPEEITTVQTTPKPKLLLYAILPQLVHFFNYDLQSVEPRRSQIGSESNLIRHVDRILDPTQISDAEILKAMIVNDHYIKIPPKSRRDVVLRVVRKTKGEPKSVDYDDLRWN